MQRAGCGLLAVLVLGMPALAQQRRMERIETTTSAPTMPLTDSAEWKWMLWNGANAARNAGAPTAPHGTVSVDTLRIPDAAMKEMQQFLKEFDAGKLPESVKHLEKALRIYPQWPGAHFNLGQTYARMGDYDKAVPELENAAALDAQMVRPLVSLAMVHCMRKDYAEAEKTARRALELDPVNRDARYFLGRALEAQGRDTIEAVEMLRQSTEQYPAAHLMLANVYLRRSAVADAVGELRDYLRQPGMPGKEKVQCLADQLTAGSSVAACGAQ